MTDIQDAIDVEFETIADGFEKKQKHSPVSQSLAIDDEVNSDEQLMVFGKKPNAHKSRSMSLPVFTLLASVCTMTAFYLSGGHVFFKNSPLQIASSEDFSPLKFEDVSHDTIDRNGQTIMTIRATIVNNDKVAQKLPPVIVHLGDDPRNQRLFRINRGEILNPGERLVFTKTVPTADGLDGAPQLTFSE